MPRRLPLPCRSALASSEKRPASTSFSLASQRRLESSDNPRTAPSNAVIVYGASPTFPAAALKSYEHLALQTKSEPQFRIASQSQFPAKQRFSLCTCLVKIPGPRCCSRWVSLASPVRVLGAFTRTTARSDQAAESPPYPSQSYRCGSVLLAGCGKLRTLERAECSLALLECKTRRERATHVSRCVAGILTP